MQLVAYGAQDIYLTGNPQITFFKVVYRRHTNFSMEAIQQTIQGNIDFENRVTISLSRNGDLIHNMWLECECEDNSKKGYEGLSVINEVQLEIGGQLIDRQTYRYMHGYLRSFNSEDKLQNISTMSEILPHENCKFIVPLLFWFCKDPGLSLPLIALQYHEVKVFLNINNGLYPLKDHDYESGIKLNNLDINFWANYIYLDTDERRRFAQVSHEYLIEQVQTDIQIIRTGKNNIYNKIPLSLNHPVKYLMWYISSDNIMSDCVLRLNGHDRFRKQLGDYFTNYQFYQNKIGNKIQNNTKISRVNFKPNKSEGLNISTNEGGKVYYLYSFGLNPGEYQPSGTCNFSRIDNAEFIMNIKTNDFNLPTNNEIHIYAVNYNVLRVMNGMGGVAYSN